MLVMVILGSVGTLAGTKILFITPEAILSASLGALTLAYLAWRLVFPDLVISEHRARVVSPMAALGSGVCQGATGAGGPIFAAYLHARRLPRRTFVRVSSAVFGGATVVQFAVLLASGSYTWRLIGLGGLALVPLLVALLLGDRIGRRLSGRHFDGLIAVTLLATSASLFFAAFR